MRRKDLRICMFNIIYHQTRQTHWLCFSLSSVHLVLVLTSDPRALFRYISSSWDWRLMNILLCDQWRSPVFSMYLSWTFTCHTAHLLQQLPVVQSHLICSIKSLIKLQFSSLFSRSALNLQCVFLLSLSEGCGTTDTISEVGYCWV